MCLQQQARRLITRFRQATTGRLLIAYLLFRQLTAALGTSVTPWLRDFAAALYADNTSGGVSAIYSNPSWNFRSIYGALYSSYANVLIPRPLSNGVGLTLSYSRGGGTAYARFGVPASGFAKVTALSGGVAPTSPYALIVMRTK